MENVRRAERGWAGHYILSDRCLFRRNTLLSFNDINIVVSTIGNLVDIHQKGYPNVIKVTTIGNSHYYETKVFHSNTKDEWYNDIDASKEIDFGPGGLIFDMERDVEANEMHESIVEQITIGLLSGLRYE